MMSTSIVDPKSGRVGSTYGKGAYHYTYYHRAGTSQLVTLT